MWIHGTWTELISLVMLCHSSLDKYNFLCKSWIDKLRSQPHQYVSTQCKGQGWHDSTKLQYKVDKFEIVTIVY